MFVVRVYDNTVLLWEGEWKESCFRFKFADDLELVYMPIYDLSDVLVYPTKAVSPLSRRIAGCKSMSGISIQQAGAPVRVEEFHTSQAWSNIDESTLALLFDEYEITAPLLTSPLAKKDPTTAFAVTLTRAFDDSITPQECLKRMARAKARTATCDEDAHGDYDLEWMKDSCLEKDVKDVESMMQEQATKKNKKKTDSENRVKFIHEAFGQPYTGTKARTKAKTKESKAQAKRIYDALDADADVALRNIMPEPSEFRLRTDHENGRWRAFFKPLGCEKSVSWTRCGSSVASCLLLKWMYQMLHEYSGFAMPGEIKEVLAQHGVDV